MDVDLLEIIELPDGDIVLRRADEEGEPLVKISFSPESELMLQSMKMDIARIMIEAGMNAFAEMNALPDGADDIAVLH